MDRDDDLQPWLRGLDDAALAQLAVDLTTAICRPSFGSLTKRELEQTVFSLLYPHRREDWRNLGEVAEDLAITRSKARSLVQEYRNRETGALPRGERLRLLREEVLSWPRRNVDQQEERLRVVIDDPFIRDLLKNFAYGRGILVDQSFSSEILVFTWDAFGKLLAALYETAGRVADEDVTTIGAELRRQVAAAAAAEQLEQGLLDRRLAELDRDIEQVLKTPAERRRARLAKLGATWGETGVGVALKVLGLS